MQKNWPELPYAAWQDTYATLHMWMQIVGKVALARAAPLNHGWGIAFHLTPRGLRTGLLTYEGRAFTMTFDFLEHQLVIETSDGLRRTLPLAPRSVAAFYREVMTTLDEMALPVRIWPMPVEIPSPIRFERDTVHHSYDPKYVERWWNVLAHVHDALTNCRCSFIGKCSPVHFFWGARRLYSEASAASIAFGLKPVRRLSPMRMTGNDIRPSSISSWRAVGSLPTLRSVNGTPLRDRYSVARWQGPQPTLV